MESRYLCRVELSVFAGSAAEAAELAREVLKRPEDWSGRVEVRLDEPGAAVTLEDPEGAR